MLRRMTVRWMPAAVAVLLLASCSDAAVTAADPSLTPTTTSSGTATSAPEASGDLRASLGRQHLACRAAEPGLLAVSAQAPDLEQQALAALAKSLPHLRLETRRAVVEPRGSEGAVAQLKAIYTFCLDNGWGADPRISAHVLTP